MQKLFYPALFTQEDIGYSITFPDLEGCFTEADTLQEGYQMAVDAIGLYLEDFDLSKDNLPVASNPKDIQYSSDEFIVIIEFDYIEYQKRHNKKAVKKTLTIPAWLNTMAEQQHINFSKVLQIALKQQLNIDD